MVHYAQSKYKCFRIADLKKNNVREKEKHITDDHKVRNERSLNENCNNGFWNSRKWCI